MILRYLQIFKQRYSKIVISIGLLFIIFGYVGNNLFWGRESPIYFITDSIDNIHWAILYGKLLRNEGLVFHPDLFEILQDKDINNIEFSRVLYYPEYVNLFKDKILQQKKINASDILKFHYPPLWFMFLGGLFAVFGLQLWVIYLAQSLLGAITIWLTYLVAKKIYSPAAGLLSAFALSTLPYFLIMTRQGFLEVMLCPMILIGIISVHCILKYPLKRIYYIFFGLICGVSTLIKSSSLIFIIVFFLVITVFVDKRKINYLSLFKNFFISSILMLLIALPWHIYAHESFLYYITAILEKCKDAHLSNLKDILVLLPMLKNAMLGVVFFVLFILGIIRFCIKPKLVMSFLLVFFICSYIFTLFMPFIIIDRHFSLFLPLPIILICCAIMDLSKFRRWMVFFILIFGLIRGYGWLVPKFSQLDTMRYFYYEITSVNIPNENRIYVTDINSNNLFSSLAPLPRWQQRAVYAEIKKIPSSYGLRLIRIIDSDKKHILEKMTLSGALSLYSLFEGYPLIEEEPSLNLYKSFQDSIWIFLKSPDININFSSMDEEKVKLKHISEVFLSPTIICDIFLVRK